MEFAICIAIAIIFGLLGGIAGALLVERYYQRHGTDRIRP